MDRIIKTEDGSHTLLDKYTGEHYHSTHGAIQESQHVFIEAGLKEIKKSTISIFEMGFGTGLNAFLTAIEAYKRKIKIHYTCIEKFPLDKTAYKKLNYPSILSFADVFDKLHESEWNVENKIFKGFNLHKINSDIRDVEPNKCFDLVFYDAFSPAVQPELWTIDIFQKIVGCMNEGAVFVTYSARGQVRRNLIDCGLKVEKLPGPPGKREMLRGVKKP